MRTSRVRRLTSALVIAGLMAVGLGTASLEAKKPGGGGGQAAICDYLQAIIEYPYTSPAILAWALALWNYYECK